MRRGTKRLSSLPGAPCGLPAGTPVVDCRRMSSERRWSVAWVRPTDTLRVTRTYVPILPENGASRRLFERLRYATDTSPAARAIADESSDVTMSLDRERFERAFEREQAELELAPLD